MARKKVVEPTAGGVGGASQVQAVAEWTEPSWADLQLDEPDPAPWPFRILFVGVNSDESADLCLKREFEKIDAALEAAFGRNSTEKPSLKQIPYTTWNEVLQEITRYHPTVLHLGCHSNKASGIKLFENTVQPESMIDAIREWNSEAREQSRHQIRVIVVNACESDVHAEKLSQCVDFTIGHYAPVDDDKAITFSDRLYCTSMTAYLRACLFNAVSLWRRALFYQEAIAFLRRGTLEMFCWDLCVVQAQQSTLTSVKRAASTHVTATIFRRLLARSSRGRRWPWDHTWPGLVV